MSQIEYRRRTIGLNNTLIDALKLMDKIDRKLLLVSEDNIFLGLVSAGDIQRAIIKNKPLDTLIKHVLRDSVKVASISDSYDNIKKMMLEFRMEMCPVINSANEIQKVYFWEDLFGMKKISNANKLDLPVVIMAGGFGTRLRPLTNVLPKPLIPIGDRTMIEEIMERFSVIGSNNFYVSLNYKADLIEFYINSQNLPYNINYFIEEKPLGTAGSLGLLKGKIDKPFFVNNCDIIIEEDYSEIYDYHISNGNEITIVAALKHLVIPYGTLTTTDNGELVELNEKPENSYWINTGMYILNPSLINEIPEGVFYHITDLIDKLKKENRRIGVFPVSEGSWLDTGEWHEYKKTQKKLYGEGF